MGRKEATERTAYRDSYVIVNAGNLARVLYERALDTDTSQTVAQTVTDTCLLSSYNLPEGIPTPVQQISTTVTSTGPNTFVPAPALSGCAAGGK